MALLGAWSTPARALDPIYTFSCGAGTEIVESTGTVIINSGADPDIVVTTGESGDLVNALTVGSYSSSDPGDSAFLYESDNQIAFRQDAGSPENEIHSVTLTPLEPQTMRFGTTGYNTSGDPTPFSAANRSDRNTFVASNGSWVLLGESNADVVISGNTLTIDGAATAGVGGNVPFWGFGIETTEAVTSVTITHESGLSNPNTSADNNSRFFYCAQLVTPELTTKKSFGTPVRQGDGTLVVPVTITVENSGDVRVDDLQVSDDLADAGNFGAAFVAIETSPVISVVDDGDTPVAVAPAANGSTFDGDAQPNILAGNDGLLGIGDVLTITFSVRLDPDAISAPAVLKNSATASANYLGTAVNDISDSSNSDGSENTADGTGGDDAAILRYPELTIAKATGAAGAVEANGTFAQGFTITLSNTGTATIDNVTLSDAVETAFGTMFDPSTVAADATSGVSVAVAVAATSGVTNTGTAPTANSGFDGNGDTALFTPTTNSLEAGDSYDVTFTVVLDATETPGGGAPDNVATANGTPPTGTALVRFGTDANGLATTNGTAGSKVTAPSVSAGTLGLLKSATLNDDDGTSGVSAGDTIDYTYVVTNTGTVNALNVTVTEPDDVSNPFSGTGTIPSPVYDSGIGGLTNLDGGASTNDLAPGASATFRASYTLTQADIIAGKVDNSSLASATDPSGDPVTDSSDDNTVGTGSTVPGQNDPTSTSLMRTPALTLSKRGVEALSSPPQVGDTIAFTLTVTNTGNVPLSQADVLPVDTMTYGTDGTGAAVATPMVIARDASSPDDNDGILEVGEVIVFYGSFTIDQAAIDARGVHNTATATGNPVDGAGADLASLSDVTATSDNDATGDGTDGTADGNGNNPTVHTIAPSASIELIKSVSAVADTNLNGLFGDAGDTITYTFSVTNTGNLALANIDVQETAIAGLSTTPVPGFDGDLAQGEGPVDAATASYVLTTADIGAGEVENAGQVTATAVATDAGGDPDPGSPIAGIGTVSDTSDTGTEPTFNSADGSVTSIANPADTDSDGSGDGINDNEPTILTLPTPTPGITLVKSVSAIADTNGDSVLGTAGDTVTYAFLIENHGNTSLASVTVSDPKLGMTNVVAAASGLAPGESATLSGITYVLIQADEDAGRFENTATASGTPVATTLSGGVPVADPGTPLVDATNTPLAAVTDLSDTGTQPFSGAGGTVVPVSGDPAIQDTNGIAGDDADEPTVINLPFVTANLKLSGTVFLDNGDGVLGSGDNSAEGAGYIVDLVDSSDTVIDTVTAAADGSFVFEGFPLGTYTVTFKTPEGVTIGSSDPVTVDASNPVVTDVNQPIDPRGVVYDAVTGAPVAGVTLEMTDASGAPLPTVCLLPGQQPQTTSASGIYAFDLVPGADPVCPVNETEYRLSLTTPSGYLSGTSGTVPPESVPLQATDCSAAGVSVDAVPGGSCQPSALSTPPSPSAPTPYFMAFLIASGDPDTINNHIAIDPVGTTPASGIVVDKAVAGDRTDFRLGETVPYQITLRNDTTSRAAPIGLRDTLPVGLVYSPESARLDGVSVAPSLDGRSISIDNLSLAPDEQITITFSARLTSQAPFGELVNRAHVFDSVTGGIISNIGTASIRRVPDAVFDCSDIIGKVFDDKNQNGYQDGPDSTENAREPGLPNIRLVTADGTIIRTDAFGRFHIPCADLPDARIGANFILKLDARSLPSGYRVTTENPRVARVTAGKVAKMNFGAAISNVVDVDLTDLAFIHNTSELTPALEAGVRQLLARVVDTPSVLRISYYLDGEDRRLARKRLEKIETFVRKTWRKHGRYKLNIERTIKRLQ